MKRLLLAVAITAAGIGALASDAGALVTLVLGVPNSALSGYPGPYGTVQVALTSSTTAQITYASNVVGGNINLFGDGGTVGVNLNAASYTTSGLSGTNSGTGFTPGPFTYAGASTEDGFGSFNLTINDFDGFKHAVDYFTFAVTNTGGTWASDADVLTANASGYRAAAHVFVTPSPAAASDSALVTGFAVDGEVTAVPEPASLLLLGLGLAGVGLLQRRRQI